MLILYYYFFLEKSKRKLIKSHYQHTITDKMPLFYRQYRYAMKTLYLRSPYHVLQIILLHENYFPISPPAAVGQSFDQSEPRRQHRTI